MDRAYKIIYNLKSFLPRKTGISQLISEEGEFKAEDFNDFLNSVRLDGGGPSNYTVVAIVGPQSSGKSTLMNRLFSTNFKEMDAFNGMARTTKGIWIAEAPVMESLTIVLDIEGTDGKQKGQDTIFEKQSTLFAIAVADIVIINMGIQDTGRENGANRPLLITIFEAMMRLFSPHKTTLLFVIRDKAKKVPFKTLEKDLRDDVHKIWEAVPKPQGSENTTLAQFFNVEVAALSHYEYAPNEFKNEVARLRLQYFDSIQPRWLVGEGDQKLPFRSAKKVWDIIKEHKDLKLPPHKVMVDTVRCEEIVMEKLRLLKSDKRWLDLQKKAKVTLVPGFGAQISSVLSEYINEYESESMYSVEDVRCAKRSYLELEALKVVHPAYKDTLGHLRSEASRSFKAQLTTLLSNKRGFAESVRECRESCLHQFDRQCSDHAAIKQAKWEDASIVRQELIGDIENRALLVRTHTLPQIEAQKRERLNTNLTKEVYRILNDTSSEEIWDGIRSYLKDESDAAALELSSALAMFKLDTREVEQRVDNLKQYGREFVVTRFKAETKDIAMLMKGRFIYAVHKNESQPTVNGVQPFDQCLKFLSMAAVIRLDERRDNVESVLFSELMGVDGDVASILPISWEEVPPEMTLITPDACREIWNKFKKDMMSLCDSAKSFQGKDRSSQLWVILGIIDRGVSGLISLIRISSINLASALKAAGGIVVHRLTETGKAFWEAIMEKLWECLFALSNRMFGRSHPVTALTNHAYDMHRHTA